VQWGDDIPTNTQTEIQKVAAALVQDTTVDAAACCAAFSTQLDLPHVTESAMEAAVGNELKLQQLAVESYRQNAKAQQVFQLLDHVGKGCVVVQDLQRAVEELELDADDWSVDELQEMMSLFDTNDTGLLSKDDVLRIARQVNL